MNEGPTKNFEPAKKWYKCPFCNEAFESKAERKEHVKRWHK